MVKQMTVLYSSDICLNSDPEPDMGYSRRLRQSYLLNAHQIEVACLRKHEKYMF